LSVLFRQVFTVHVYLLQDLTNHPAFMTEVDWSKPLTPELEALMRLKYEDENPTGFILIHVIWRKCLFRT